MVYFWNGGVAAVFEYEGEGRIFFETVLLAAQESDYNPADGSIITLEEGGMSKKKITVLRSSPDVSWYDGCTFAPCMGMSRSCSICRVYRRTIWKATWKKKTDENRQSRWRPPFDVFCLSVQTADWLGKRQKDTSNRKKKRFGVCRLHVV